jgi:hypothetical protein
MPSARLQEGRFFSHFFAISINKIRKLNLVNNTFSTASQIGENYFKLFSRNINVLSSHFKCYSKY